MSRSGLRGRLRQLGRRVRHGLRPPDYRILQRRVAELEGNLEHLLQHRYPALLPAEDARAAFRSHELKVHSQNGEDGLLLHLFDRIGVPTRQLVEFGIQDGRECNAANLVLGFGWGGLLMDCGEQAVARARAYYHDECGVPRERLRIERERLDADNVDERIRAHGMKGEIDLLSIDIDSNDYWVWRAIHCVEPRVVAIEYNASFGPEAGRICRYAPDFDRALHPRGWYHGASLAAFTKLATRRGYLLAGCDSRGVNAFFVRAELAEGRIPAQTPTQAWYPHQRRLKHATAEQQAAQLEGLPYAEDPDAGAG